MTSPKKRKAVYRSSNGEQRPYQSGGRWYAPIVVTAPDGTKIQVRGTGDTQAKAKERARGNAAKKLASLQSNANTSSYPRLTAEWCQHWLDNLKVQSPIRYSTRVGYQSAITSWIAPHLGGIALSELGPEHLDHLYVRFVESGLSGSIWRHVRTVLNQALTEALRRECMERDVTRFLPKVPRARHSTAHRSREEAEALLAHVTRDAERARTYVAVYLGLRQGEALGLQWHDLDLTSSTPTLTIRRSLRRQTGRGLVCEEPKTVKSNRTLPLPSVVVDALRGLRAQKRKDCFALGHAWSDDAFVFTTSIGTPVDPANDRKAWFSLLDRAGLPRIKLHGARHTAATLLLHNNINLKVVSEILGHSSISTTADIYAHPSQGAMRDALESTVLPRDQHAAG